ncbi:MAG TPA: RNA methyltransferase [Anaerolineales bacterium]|nr:RNA methyltransferase [Anaerolineales bacterium]
MQKPFITSLSNALIKQARALRQKKARLETGTFLVEGIHHVGQAMEAGWDIETILYAPDLLTSRYGRDVIATLHAKAQPVSSQVMESLADKDNPQGMLAIVRQRQVAGFSRFAAQIQRAVALVFPQDPGNVGTILRTLDAVKADALFLLDGGVDPYHPTVVRSSMGTIFWTPIMQASFQDFIAWAHDENCQLIATSARGDVDYKTLVPQIPWILVLGNEQKGLSTEQTNACDVAVSIPMRGRVSSLNLAVAAGVLLYHFTHMVPE